MILPKHCIVGAGSVVTKSFDQEGCVIAGNPARMIGSIDHIRETKEKNKFNFKGMSAVQKKAEILNYPERYIRK